MLFVEKAKDTSPLTDLINEELFKQEPERLRTILNGLIIRSAISSKKLA
jgi:hypothetical protein